jgi:ribosomal protein S18 acetylase RimI-like enzyme
MENASIEIRRGTPADAEVLAEFGRRAYEEAFGADNDPDNLAIFLETRYGVEQQTEELTRADVITLLAETEGHLIGFAQVRHSTAPDCVVGEDVVELWRFYVDRPFHGRGVAQRMMPAALRAASDLGGRMIWLSVWEENPRAITFYIRCGFEDVGTTDFWVGSDRQTDRVLVKEIE